MQAVLEKLKTDSDRSFHCLQFSSIVFNHPFHFHPEIEITFIEASFGTRIVGDHIGRFEAGDLVIIGENLPHHYINQHEGCTGPCWAKSIVIQFRKDILGDTFFALPEMAAANRMLEKARLGLYVPKETALELHPCLKALLQQPPERRIVLLLDLLQSLAQVQDLQTLASEGYSPKLNEQDTERLNKVTRLINSRYDQDLSQEEVARELHISPSAFSRYFRKRTGKTFVAFLTEVRLGHACRMLQVTDRTVLEICYASGFSNLSNFNRRFRQYCGLTPTEYRKRFQ